MSWPPLSLSQEAELPGDKAELLISRGALFFEGFSLPSNHTLIRQPRFYATVSFAGKYLEASSWPGSTVADASRVLGGQPLEQPSMVDCFGALPGTSQPGSTDMSLVLGGQPLEQPSMAECFGVLPGTVTLSRYINVISGPRPPEHLPECKIQPRATDNLLVLQRLHYLMRNGWDEDVSQGILLLSRQRH